MSGWKLETVREFLAAGTVELDSLVKKAFPDGVTVAPGKCLCGQPSVVDLADTLAPGGKCRMCREHYLSWCKLARLTPTDPPTDPRKPKPARKPWVCLPWCSPARACNLADLGCKAALHKAEEARIAAATAADKAARATFRKKFDITKKPPRPQVRRIGAADLTFGRWNGRGR